MKKKLIFLTVVSLLLSCFCAQNVMGLAEETDGDLVLPPTLDICSVDSNEVYVGMPMSEFYTMVDREDLFQSGKYHFFTDCNLIDVVMEIDGPYPGTIARIEKFEHKIARAADFSKIVDGLTLYEVVDIIGLPYASFTSGMYTMEFTSIEGDSLCVYWTNDSETNETIVYGGTILREYEMPEFPFSKYNVSFSVEKINVDDGFNWFKRVLKDDKVIHLRDNYYFFTDVNGTDVMVEFGNDSLGRRFIQRIETYEEKTATTADFYKIRESMTIYEVVELLGLPFDTMSVSTRTLGFVSSEGDILKTYWDNDATIASMALFNARGNETQIEFYKDPVPEPGVEDENTPPDAPSYNFNSYDDINNVFAHPDSEEGVALNSEKNLYGKQYVDFVNAMMSDATITVPKLNNDVVALRNIDGYSNVTLFVDELYNLPWIWYHCQSGSDNSLSISITDLSVLDDFEVSATDKFSDVVRKISPSAPNVDNYMNISGYEKISETDIRLADRTVSALIYELEDEDRIMVGFMYDTFYVRLRGHFTTFNEEFFAAFSLGKYSETSMMESTAVFDGEPIYIPTEPSTEPPTEPSTESSTEPSTEPSTNNTQNDAKGSGCGSSVSIGFVGLASALAAGYVFLKKKIR